MQTDNLKIIAMITFFERIPQKPLLLIFQLDPSIISKERFPENNPINKEIKSNEISKRRYNFFVYALKVYTI